MITKTTHAESEEAQRRYWRSLTAEERLEITVEMSHRMRQMEIDNGRTSEEVASLTKRRRR